MSAESNKFTIEKIYEALETVDQSVFSASVHPDYIWKLPGQSSWCREFRGQTAIRDLLLRPLFRLFATTYTARLINCIAEGDQVVAEVRGDVLTHKGARYNNEYCFVFKFRTGKITSVTEYCDTDLEERVLGPYEAALAAASAVRST